MSFGGRDLVGELAEQGIQQFRRELVLQERATAVRLRRAYERLIQPVRQRILVLQVTAQTNEDFQRLVDLQALEQEMTEGLAELESLLEMEGRRLSESAAQLGTQYAEISAGVTVGWNTPDPAAIRRLASYMDSAAMQEALSQFGPYHGKRLADLALAGISKGWNPRRTAQAMLGYVDNYPLADAERMMRTVQLWSYRTATHESWRENSSVVRGWWWRASLGDVRTCISCISMHGTRHGLDKILDDHHRGRCVPVPIVAGRALPPEDAGERWFREQPQEAQIRTMNRARWLAWQDGQFEFAEISRVYDDPIYGAMRTDAPLVTIVGRDTAREYIARARAERSREF